MTGMKAYWESLKSLRTDQRAFVPAIEWLVDNTDDPRVRRSGRTTVLATAFLRAACLAPHRQVRVFDHVPGSESGRTVIRAMEEVIDRVGAQRWFHFKTGNSPSIEATGGWSFEQEDPNFRKQVLTMSKRTRESKPVATPGCGPESVLEDLRSAAIAALELGASPDQIMGTVQDAIVRDVMEG